MANTIMTAKNSFAEGLIMDFAPDNTQATCMTSALNATLLTFNGNEMQLQNDMGNGRVETAYLPEGYIPVGTCEFGDIIYIVSYNPITNKSQIGCFPSPERNISSDEISDLGQVLKASEFQVLDGNEVTGELIRTSIKKILINNKLNPGDKYVIYTDANKIEGNSNHLSDYGPDEKHGKLPKHIKLHVVSIDDTNRITYLDTTTKWYNIDLNNKYYINSNATKDVNGTKVPDIDSYRNLLQSGWSIFSSKIPGKLAILAELETIEDFQCEYQLDMEGIVKEEDITYKKYKLSLTPSYTYNGISLPYICITKSFFNNQYEDKGSYKIPYLDNTLDVSNIVNSANLNSGWTLPEPGEDSIGEKIEVTIDTDIIFKIPYKDKNDIRISSDSFIYNFEVVPAMEFGRLNHLKIPLTIDFNKVGTGDVDLTTWKYHNSEELGILTFGFNTYPKPGYEVKYITMDFYDNSGPTAHYLLDDKSSYSGIFNEYFTFNNTNSNIRVSNYITPDPKKEYLYKEGFDKKSYWKYPPSEWYSLLYDNLADKDDEEYDKLKIKHYGAEITKEEYIEGQDLMEPDPTKPDPTKPTKYYKYDAGILYSRALYAVKISVYQAPKKGDKITEKLEVKTFYKWYWTNTMFNEYYYNTEDFENLNFELVLKSEAIFASKPENYFWKTKEVNNLNQQFNEDEIFKTYSANIQYIGDSQEPNLEMYLRAGLYDDYGCFNLYNKPGNDNPLKSINVNIYMGPGEIKYSFKGDQFEASDEQTNITELKFLQKNNRTFNYITGVPPIGGSTETIPEDKLITFKGFEKLNSPINIQNMELQDDFNISFTDNAYYDTKVIMDDGSEEYYTVKNTNLSECYYQNDDLRASIPLKLEGIIFDKAYVQNIYNDTISVPVYSPIINEYKDFSSLGLKYLHYIDDNTVNIRLGFGNAISLTQDENTHLASIPFSSTKDEKKENFVYVPGMDNVYSNEMTSVNNTSINTSSDNDFIDQVWNNMSSNLSKFFLVYPGGDTGTYAYSIVKGSVKNTQDVSTWFNTHWGNPPNTNSYHNHNVTHGSYGITSSTFVYPDNNTWAKVTAFLGMKYKNGFTLFNSAFADDKDAKGFRQQAGTVEHYRYKSYENFAYHLYLLLTNTYHKNKRSENHIIQLKNYIRNGEYDITFTKNIIVKLFVNEQTNNNNDILLRGIDFKEYKKSVSGKLGNDAPQDFINQKNVSLKFIDSANNNMLSITMKGQQFPFLNINAEAYLLRNGELVPTYNLADNTFYVYQNNQLEVYQNRLLTFNIEEVNDNLKYILPSNEIKDANSINLIGISKSVTKHYTEEQTTFNNFVNEIYRICKNYSDGINENRGDVRYFTRHNCTDIAEVISYKELFIDYIYRNLPKFINKVPTENLMRQARKISLGLSNFPLDGGTREDFGDFGIFESFFDVELPHSEDFDGNTQYQFVLFTYPNYEGIPEQYSTKPNPNYSFNCGMNLNVAFQYDNGLNLIKDRSYSDFGMCEDPEQHDVRYMYTGFMEDIVVDEDFQVLQ